MKNSNPTRGNLTQNLELFSSLLAEVYDQGLAAISSPRRWFTARESSFMEISSPTISSWTLRPKEITHSAWRIGAVTTTLQTPRLPYEGTPMFQTKRDVVNRDSATR